MGKIAAGVAPTSTLSESAVDSRDPWTPVCVTTRFPHKILCADQWHNDLVVGTAEGIFRINIGWFRFPFYFC